MSTLKNLIKIAAMGAVVYGACHGDWAPLLLAGL